MHGPLNVKFYSVHSVPLPPTPSLPRVFGSSGALSTSLIPTALSLVYHLLCYCQKKKKQDGVALNNKTDTSSESVLKIVVSLVVTSIVL
jgi:hypothetical protein